MLQECITIVSDLNRKTAELAANITADFAPSHIRKTAEYVGAFVYRFYSIDKLVGKLLEMDWLKAVGDTEKPAVCVIRNSGLSREVQQIIYTRNSILESGNSFS